ncbi:hypothetical protein XELAEV_18046955mg [Xenopus laevis]|uniref:Uncharacterized protein n=1 Tax=Xenopus laevis TaxID=8355 RepID=A0A974H142_XENLA|nr:hypothetical protein XELAEV_18046955mg [Xenopus laevis]
MSLVNSLDWTCAEGDRGPHQLGDVVLIPLNSIIRTYNRAASSNYHDISLPLVGISGKVLLQISAASRMNTVVAALVRITSRVATAREFWGDSWFDISLNRATPAIRQGVNFVKGGSPKIADYEKEAQRQLNDVIKYRVLKISNYGKQLGKVTEAKPCAGNSLLRADSWHTEGTVPAVAQKL